MGGDAKKEINCVSAGAVGVTHEVVGLPIVGDGVYSQVKRLLRGQRCADLLTYGQHYFHPVRSPSSAINLPKIGIGNI